MQTVTEEQFNDATNIARVKSLFHTVDISGDGAINRKELWKAMRKYNDQTFFN